MRRVNGEAANVLYSNRENVVSREARAKKSPRVFTAAIVAKLLVVCVWYD
jgi:hypothetical protein